MIETEDYSNFEEYARKFESVVRDLAKDKNVAIIVSKELAEKISVNARVILLGSRKDMYELCRNLFKSLRRLDELNVDLGIIEGFEEKGLGLTLMDRIRNASNFKILKV